MRMEQDHEQDGDGAQSLHVGAEGAVAGSGPGLVAGTAEALVSWSGIADRRRARPRHGGRW